MGPIADAKGPIQHDYRFPLSPPPSAHSSPCAGPLGDASVTKQHVYRRSTSHSVHWSKTTDGDPLANPTSEQHGPSPRKRPGTSHSSRSLTMPLSSRDSTAECGFTLDPPKVEKSLSLSRRSSSSTLSSASSGRNQPHSNPTSSTTAGIGRKVAASLQLFKESAPRSPSEEKISGFPKADKLLGKRRPSSSHKNENVSEAKYEFVKRTDWPDPETAALRRERSSTALKRIRTRESISSHSIKDQESSRARGYTRDSAMHDLSEWRKDVSKQETLRGRRRERASEASVFEFDLGVPRAEPSVGIPSPYIRPRSRGKAPSPSPSLSPTHRVLPLALYNIASDFGSPSARNGHKVNEQRSPRSVSLSLRSRSPTSIHASTYTSESLSLPSSVLHDDVRPYSPWSTDDESAWETTSVTTDASTTTGTSEHPSPSRGVAFPSSYPAAASDEEFERSAHDDLEGGESPPASDTWTARHLDMTFGASDESLPHIPLRPFRNQVGGHSAIYKFTKRAVCKPLVSRENQFYEAVEREAPPLLGFIPRYLGVMLVTYRRVFKGSLTPTYSDMSTPHPSSAHQPPPDFHKFPSHHPHRPTLSTKFSEEDPMSGYESSEEMPEVVLDRNRHIVPEWVLRLGGRKRDRSMSHSHSPPYHRSPDAARHLKSMCAMTASTPDLMRRESLGTSMKCSPLTRQDTIPLEKGEAPTPSNSPERLLPGSSFSDPRSTHCMLAQEVRRPDLRLFRSEMSIGQQQSTPSWFGGTGSTMVNTKLKDHVFNTILRRFQRQHHGKWSSSSPRVDDEGETADHEGRLINSARHIRSHHRKHPVGHSESVMKRNKGTSRSPSVIRRVQSESAMDTKDTQEWTTCMGYDTLQDIMSQPQGFDQDQLGVPSDTMRRRSRSRSVDFPVPTMRRSSEPVPSKPSSVINSDDSITRQNHFIFMEDLTGRLKRSCVLDLKMGTRQYGMDATLAKKKSQRKKCDRTTSRPLGIRVCGMQVWNNATQAYVTQDKYMGRDVKPEEFESVLSSFLYDGERLLVWQIPILLQKLYALARIINRLKGFRFYGCSLLLIYDGDREAQEAFRTCALEHPSSRSKRGESLERSRARSNTSHERPLLRRTHSEDLLVGPVSKRSSGKRKRGEVNVRIVDFAHTTTGRDWLPYPPPPNRDVIQRVSSSKGYQAEVDAETGLIYARFPPHYPEEPDRGFLFGLKNLAETLENIWNEERIRRIKPVRDDPSAVTSQLPPLPSDGKEIFDKIFDRLEPDEDPGMLST